MPPEVDPDALAKLGGLAAPLAGDREQAARLVGETLAAVDRRRRTPEPTTLRDLLVECYLRQRPGPVVAPPADDPGELDEVIARLGGLGPFERAALVLLRHQGLPLAEVAGVLDSSAATVRRRVAEAEERLSLDPLAVRAALETLSWRTPDAAAVAAARFRAQQANIRRRGRRRMLALALGLVLLAALVVPTVRMLQPLPVRTAGAWLLGIDLEPPPGWSTELHAVTPDQELLQLASETGSCRVVASLPSTPSYERTEPPTQAERVWVRGRSVQYFGSGLRWVYGDGGDVTLTCTDQDRAGLLGMADRMRFTAGRPFTLPFGLEQLPTGMRLVGAGYQ